MILVGRIQLYQKVKHVSACTLSKQNKKSSIRSRILEKFHYMANFDQKMYTEKTFRNINTYETVVVITK